MAQQTEDQLAESLRFLDEPLREDEGLRDDAEAPAFDFGEGAWGDEAIVARLDR